MNLRESIQVSLGALAAHKLRSGLTILGIVIGISAVIALMALGRGAQSSITANLQGMGTSVLFVRPGAPVQMGGVRMPQGSAATLTVEDARAIAERVPQVVTAAPEFGLVAQVVAGGQNVNTRIIGATPDYQTVRNWYPAQGEFISTAQVDGQAMVAVIGSNVALNLFGEGDPLGESIRINTRTFKVIGVLQTKGGGGFALFDDQIIVPISLQSRLNPRRTASGASNVSNISVQVDREENLETARAEIEALLRQRHRIQEGRPDDFTVSSQQELTQAFSQVVGVFTLVLGAIASISLLVGGIGIMNIMIVSVTERTREIGLRKALGAKRRDILVQFIIESIALSFAGGVLGFLLGWAESLVLSGIRVGGTTLQSEIAPDIVVLALGVSAVIGVFFGIYPAYRASQLHPIQALRWE
ncbi:MAG: ABC transporter permease [Chloroflexi bacterium]|nr:ABC transporter permease [Chloroflexota bacterium]